jgi:hypothetical protein
VIGNSVQWIAHLLIMAILARNLIDLSGLRLGEALFKCALAGLGMAGAVWVIALALAQFGIAAQLIGAILIGGGVYVGLCLLLRVEALGFFVDAVLKRSRR